MAGTLDDLIAHAEGVGLTVEERPLHHHNALLLPGGHVLLNSRRSLTTRRYALAHECGHWHHGHDWRLPHDRDRDEREADEHAATLLIDYRDYTEAELLNDGHVGGIAQALQVPSIVVVAYQGVLRRDGLIGVQDFRECVGESQRHPFRHYAAPVR